MAGSLAGRGVLAFGLLAVIAPSYALPAWSTSFFGSGANREVNTIVLFDFDGDGPGPVEVVVGGQFTSIGGQQASRVARWNAGKWQQVGDGFDSTVTVLAVVDLDGAGPNVPSLYAGGIFQQSGAIETLAIARWNGAAWEPVGGGLTNEGQISVVNSIVAHDDGSGSALYAGGQFSESGAIPIRSVGRWDGKSWAPVGDGLAAFSGIGAAVLSLCLYDSDNDPLTPKELVAAGAFDVSGVELVPNIARWNGVAWSSVGGGTDAIVGTVVSVPIDGAGEVLVAGGSFQNAGLVPANRLAIFDGESWAPFGTGASSPVESLCVRTVAGQTRILATGAFTTIGGEQAHRIAEWDGSSWTALGDGLTGSSFTYGSVALPVSAAGFGPDTILVGGSFERAGDVRTNHLALWTGDSWETFGAGIEGARVSSLVATPGGPCCESVVAGGEFYSAGGAIASNIASWNGEEWRVMGEGVGGGVNALEWHDAGNGGALYAGGVFLTAGGAPAARIAKWDGATWSALGAGVSGGPFPGVFSLRTLDLDGAGAGAAGLFVGGLFTTAGTTPALNIARWDGAQWHALGGGVNGYVFALAGFDDGSGPALYVGGSFFNAGGIGQPGAVQAANIARWNGVSWSALDVGVDGPVRALAVFDDDGAGPTPPALYLGGDFTLTNAGPALGVARWSGSAWSALGTGLGGVLTPSSSALRVADTDGAGPGAPALVVAGTFNTAGGVTARNIAVWDGASWAPLDAGSVGTNGQVRALATFDDDGAGPKPPALYLGGVFSMAGDVSSVRIARFGADAASCPGDTNGDNIVNFADLNACLGAFGIAQGATLAQGDIDGDGDVDFADLNVILSNFGAAC